MERRPTKSSVDVGIGCIVIWCSNPKRSRRNDVLTVMTFSVLYLLASLATSEGIIAL